jgi:acyl-CoA reductase-like NAD-dependent aldehyde dehydrogenase|tara:strand:+ start:124058 stop:125485 length:1428 start_codon:yes stop_codon:yes gene_type:complete
MKTSNLWIDGQEVLPSGGLYFDDINPSNQSIIAKVAKGTTADIDKAVAAAKKAFMSFSQTQAKDREAILSRAAALVERDKEEYLQLLIDEVGSPIMKAQFEVDYCINAFRAAAGVPRRLTGETMPLDRPGAFGMSVREPVGIIACITPFNVPLLKNVKQIAMVIATGNTSVLLPSEFATQVTVKFAETLAEAGTPPGVFNYVTGDPFEIGDHLTCHKDIASINFCGSPRIGKHVAELAAKDLKPITLELGGKNPLVVLDDADLDKALEAAMLGIFFFQGQACMASSRIILQRGIADKFIPAFKNIAANIKVGDLSDPQTAIGPIISDRQQERVKNHINDALAKGAIRLHGEEGWKGACCPPTILTNVDQSMSVCREETFGPVTSIYEVDTVEEAVNMANDTEFGLSFSLFTRDITTALKVAKQSNAGMVHINAMSIQDEPHVPFGGNGMSGFGREGTDADLDIMTRWKWITIQLD